MNTKIVGILNITPDSFSDGGKFYKAASAIQHLQQMLDEGAYIIDIGAESTRPNAAAITANEEWQRLENILPHLVEEVQKFNCDVVLKKKSKQESAVEISIDSYHPSTAKRAYEVGANIINDVSGLQNEEMIDFIAAKNAKTIFMHSLSVPANPEIIINRALNVTAEILKWAEEKIAYLENKGVKKSQLIFDPGVGFSKNAEQSLRIIKNIAAFKELGLPLYVGHSKKSFLDILNVEGLENNKESRLQKTLILSNYLAKQGTDYIRVHDVAKNKEAIKSQFSTITLL